MQCYYASPEVIVAFIEIISARWNWHSVLLKRHAKSVSCPRKRDGVLRIGASITLHRDWDYDVDTIHDDTEVSLRAEMLKNMILSGADDRVLRSMLTSLFIWWIGGKEMAPDCIFSVMTKTFTRCMETSQRYFAIKPSRSS